MVVFLSRILSVGTGFIFLVMVTRWLNPQQFGLWEFILDIVTFASYPAGLLTYWATREVARGNKVGKTAILASMLMSVIGIGFFLAVSFLSHDAVNSPITPFIAAALLVPLNYWSLSTSSLVSGYDPAITGYSLILSEISKIAAGYILLFDFKLRIIGVIISVCISYFVQSSVSTYMLRHTFESSFDIPKLKNWLSQSYVPAISTLNYVIAIADTFVASIGQGNTLLAGYYQAAYQIATVVGYSGYLASALYPLLLQNKHEKIVHDLLDYTMLFAIPMAAGAIALGEKILFLLSPVYVESFFALSVLSFASILNILSNILDQTLTGIERADLTENRKTYYILRSNLTIVPLANFLYSVSYITSVFVVGLFSHLFTPSISSLQWASLQMILLIVLLSFKLWRVKKVIAFSFPKSVIKYIFVSLAMALFVYTLSKLILYPDLPTITYAIRLLFITLLGATLYFSVLLALDRRLREQALTFLHSL